MNLLKAAVSCCRRRPRGKTNWTLNAFVCPHGNIVNYETYDTGRPTPAENIYKAPVKFTAGFHRKSGNDYKNNMEFICGSLQ